jgi:hypothetical protein
MTRAEKRLPRALIADPADVARAGLDALEAGRRTVVPGLGPRVLNFIGGHAPRSLWLPVSRRMMG